MKILVTGAAGFIGAALSLKLLERGEDVIGIDNLNDYYDVNLKHARLARLTPFENFKFVHEEKINNFTFDVILLDMNFSRDVNTGNEGFYWLDFILDKKKDQKVILFTAFGGIEWQKCLGGTGNDVSYCASGDLNGWNGQGGNDRLGLRNQLFNSAPSGVLNVSGTINMGSGNDELAIWSYDAANTLNINPSTVFNTLGGDDLVTLYTIGSGELTVKGLYNLGAGNDTLRADGKVSISGPINGGDGNDSFYFGNNADGSPYHSGPERPVINSDISGDAGNDFFSLENGVTVCPPWWMPGWMS